MRLEQRAATSLVAQSQTARRGHSVGAQDGDRPEEPDREAAVISCSSGDGRAGQTDPDELRAGDRIARATPSRKMSAPRTIGAIAMTTMCEARASRLPDRAAVLPRPLVP